LLSVTPDRGSIVGGTEVTIVGSGFPPSGFKLTIGNEEL